MYKSNGKMVLLPHDAKQTLLLYGPDWVQAKI